MNLMAAIGLISSVVTLEEAGRSWVLIVKDKFKRKEIDINNWDSKHPLIQACLDKFKAEMGDKYEEHIFSEEEIQEIIRGFFDQNRELRVGCEEKKQITQIIKDILYAYNEYTKSLMSSGERTLFNSFVPYLSEITDKLSGIEEQSRKENVTNNFNYIENDNNTKDNVNSWFSERFEIFLSLLNEARTFNEKEYTVEYVSSLIGLKNVDSLKVYLKQDKEPDDEFKKKFVDAFGVNEEWMVHNRGEFPFESNINFGGKNPMDILRRENLSAINKFIVVIGKVEGKRQACIIRKKKELCYELYPKYFTLNSCVGAGGATNLVEFYRFLREANKIKKLDEIVHVATEEQMEKLKRGEFSPKKVVQFEVERNFIDDFMCISEDEIARNKKNWDEEFILVQEIIAANIKDYDRINQESDLKLIKKNLGEDSRNKWEKCNDIDSFDASTSFFSDRFGKAFPGVRGIEEFTNPKDCIDRLQILLKKPLSGKTLRSPICWFRGVRYSKINNFERISDDKFLLDSDEIKVKRIVAYAAGEYYKNFVYVEACPEDETGLYQHDKNYIKSWVDKYGYYNEEYAEYENNKVTRSEYDDDAAVIDGKIVDLKGEAKLRIRYITPYNFIICAQFNPINNNKYNDRMVTLLNGVLKGLNSVEEIVKFVNKMPRDRRDN